MLFSWTLKKKECASNCCSSFRKPTWNLNFLLPRWSQISLAEISFYMQIFCINGLTTPVLNRLQTRSLIFQRKIFQKLIHIQKEPIYRLYSCLCEPAKFKSDHISSPVLATGGGFVWTCLLWHR